MSGRVVSFVILLLLLGSVPARADPVLSHDSAEPGCTRSAYDHNQTWTRFDGPRYHHQTHESEACLERWDRSEVGAGPASMVVEERAGRQSAREETRWGPDGPSDEGHGVHGQSHDETHESRTASLTVADADLRAGESCASRRESSWSGYAEPDGSWSRSSQTERSYASCTRGLEADHGIVQVGAKEESWCVSESHEARENTSYVGDSGGYDTDERWTTKEDACHERFSVQAVGETFTLYERRSGCAGTSTHRDAETYGEDPWANNITRWEQACDNETSMGVAGVARLAHQDRHQERDAECYRDAGGPSSCWWEEDASRGFLVEGPAGVRVFHGESSQGHMSCWERPGDTRWCNASGSASDGTTIAAGSGSVFLGDHVEGSRGCYEEDCGARGAGSSHGVIVEVDEAGLRHEQSLPRVLP